jgi:hypothetical protein
MIRWFYNYMTVGKRECIYVYTIFMSLQFRGAWELESETLYDSFLKVARYSYHKHPAQESRTQNRETIFTRRSRKLINKMKELPKWPDVSSCSRHITPLRVFRSVLCQLLTSLEFSILEKQCAISLYFVWWPMFKFCMLYCTAKNFHYTKNKKNSVMPKSFYRRIWHFAFSKKMALQNFFIFCLLLAFRPSKIMHEKKLGVTMFFFQLYETIGHFGVNFVHVCRHSNELSVTKINIIWK